MTSIKEKLDDLRAAFAEFGFECEDLRDGLGFKIAFSQEGGFMVSTYFDHRGEDPIVDFVLRLTSSEALKFSKRVAP